MIHDIDLVDHLVTLIRAAAWSPLVADVRRVWGGNVHQGEIPDGRIIVQLWPDTLAGAKIARDRRWSTTSTVGILFASRIGTLSMGEIDAVVRSIDDLLLSTDLVGLGADLLDVVDVASRSNPTEFATCTRSDIVFPLRPNPESLDRAKPDGDAEQYAGLLHVQAVMSYEVHQ